MKIILLFVLLLQILPAQLTAATTQAKPKRFLRCLAQEELYYHNSKISGPYKKLNQKLISEFVQLSDTLSLKNKYQKDICENSKLPSSLVLLKLLLTKRVEVFQFNAKKLDIGQVSLDKISAKDLVKQSFFVFIEFINDLQSISKSSNCVINRIPEIKRLYSQARYSLENQGIKKLIDDIKHFDDVFEKLNSKNILDKC